MRILFVFLLLSSNGICQSTDRYKAILESDTSSHETKISALTSILLAESKSLPDSTVVDYYLQLASNAKAAKRYDDAIAYCDTILKGFKRKLTFVELKSIEETKAMIYKSAGKTDVAISMLLELLAEYEDAGHLEQSADLNNRVGIIFLKMGELKDAEYHLKESVEQARKIKNYNLEASSLMSLGNRFKKENKFEQAEDYYKQSIQLCKNHDFKRFLAGNYNNIGSLNRMMDKPDMAMYYYKKAVEINLEIGNDQWLSYNYNNLGNIYKAKKQYDQALHYFKLSNEIKERLGDDAGKVYTLLNLSEVYEAKGNIDEALRLHKQHTKLKDSLSELDRLEHTKELAAQFQSERREAEIIQLNMQDELNKKELDVKDERLRYQNSLTWFFGIGILLVIGIALTLWRSVVNRKKINQQLEVKNSQIDEKNTEIIDSINYAKRIQNTILPKEDDLQELLPKHALLYKPKDIISGDFYICEEVNDNLFFGTVDCTGHGVPGAMVSIVASNSFSKMIHELNLREPAEILDQLDVDVPMKLESKNQEVVDGMDMALCRLNPSRNKLSFAGAYQNCWIFNSESNMAGRDVADERIERYDVDGGTLLEIKGNRKGIGMLKGSDKFDQFDINVQPGDKILVSTDGFQDQFGGPGNKKFKVKQMRDIVMANMNQKPNQIMDALTKAMADWQGDQEQIDDICVFIVEL